MCARISHSSSKQSGHGGGSESGPADAHAELKELASDLRGAVLDVVWRQWREIGAGAAGRAAVGGAGTSSSGNHAAQLRTVADPEALVLVSLLLMGEERRLADLLHDWAVWNSDLLSVQRIRNLARSYPAAVRDVLAPQLTWFAETARDTGKDLRWRSVVEAEGKPTGKRSAATRSASAASYVRSEAVRGAVRRVAEPTKVRAVRARLTTPASLILRLRLGFGVGVKADMLGFLLAHAGEHLIVRDIVAATGYTSAAVRRAAEDLAAARLIRVREGQPVRYGVEYGTWAPVLGLGGEAPAWGSWHERFVFTVAFLQWGALASERPLSSYAFGVGGRELLEEHRSAFERDGLAIWSGHSSIPDWGEFVRGAVEGLVRWMRESA